MPEFGVRHFFVVDRSHFIKFHALFILMLHHIVDLLQAFGLWILVHNGIVSFLSFRPTWKAYNILLVDCIILNGGENTDYVQMYEWRQLQTFFSLYPNLQWSYSYHACITNVSIGYCRCEPDLCSYAIKLSAYEIAADMGGAQ